MRCGFLSARARTRVRPLAIQALDVVLCWGWIDGIRKALADRSYLQRYTPRRPKSSWSQVNRDHVARLNAAGRMTPHGQRQVGAAKGGWPLGRRLRAYPAGVDGNADPRGWACQTGLERG